MLSYYNQKIERAKTDLEKIERTIPELESLFSLIGNKPKVLFFEGPETISTICEDMVSGKGDYEMISFSNADKFKDSLDQAGLKKFIQQKSEKNIITKGILPDTPGNRAYGQNVFEGIDKKYWPKVKYIPAEKFPYEAEITLYGQNKVTITKLGGPNIIGVIIEDKTIHDMMKMIFELSWGNPELKE